MNTITRSIRNPYETKKGFLADPFASLYQAPDEDVLQPESVEGLLHYAWSLEECVPGDFDLQTVVTEIKSQVLSFVRTGLLAYKVKVFKLYRNVHKNFRVFCEKALGVSHWQVNRTIEAARVVMELAQAGFSVLPTCEAQARPLTKLYGAELCDKWQMVVDELEPHTITSNRINEVLGVETKAASLRLPKELCERIRTKALEMGLSIEQLLDMIFDDEQGVSLVDEEALAKWEEDLETLASQEPETIQADEESVPIGQTSGNPSSNSPPSRRQQTSRKPTNQGGTATTQEYTDSAPPSDPDSRIPRAKKAKRKKPLLEVLSLDRKSKSEKKPTKEEVSEPSGNNQRYQEGKSGHGSTHEANGASNSRVTTNPDVVDKNDQDGS